MSISNKALYNAIKKANKYIQTLEEQKLTDTRTYKTLRESATRAARGTKAKTRYYTPRPKNGKFTKAQRAQMLKAYAEIQIHKDDYINKPIAKVKKQRRTFDDTETSKAIRSKLSKKYSVSEDVFTDQFFDFLNTEAMQLLMQRDVFGSDIIEEIIDKIQDDNSILDNLDLLEDAVNAYVDNPHRDEYYVNEFMDIFGYFKYGTTL